MRLSILVLSLFLFESAFSKMESNVELLNNVRTKTSHLNRVVEELESYKNELGRLWTNAEQERLASDTSSSLYRLNSAISLCGALQTDLEIRAEAWRKTIFLREAAKVSTNPACSSLVEMVNEDAKWDMNFYRRSLVTGEADDQQFKKQMQESLKGVPTCLSRARSALSEGRRGSLVSPGSVK